MSDTRNQSAAPANTQPRSGSGSPPEAPLEASSDTAVASPPASPPPLPARPLIAELAGAVVSTAPDVRGQSLYVGWTDERLPVATGRLADLSEQARDDLAAYRGSGLPVRRVPYRVLVPATYVVTGSAIDFTDSPRRKAEDQVRYTVVDAEGTRRDIALGEVGVLEAIGAAKQPWQVKTGQTVSNLAVDTRSLYTIFAPLPGARPDLGLALLFEPLIEGASNEAAFRSFVRHTIGRLLLLDESQPPEGRKGYLDVAGKLAGSLPKGGLLQTLVRLRQLGFVEFDDSWLAGLEKASKAAQGSAIRLMRALGMVVIDDDTLHQITDYRPDYDVDRLDLLRLIDLAEQMGATARRALA